LNATFELRQAEVSDPTKANVEAGSPKAFAIAEKQLEAGGGERCRKALG